MADRDQIHASNRGFAAIDEKAQREIAGKGGQASGANFKNDPKRAAEAGRGQEVPAEQRSFSKDHELADEAGRKGGEHAHGGTGGQYGSRQYGSRHQGGRGNFAEAREPASEAGRKGGEHSRDRR